VELENTYLVIDSETGGLDPGQHSLLSVAGVIWEPGKKIEELFNFYVREDPLCVIPEAIEVNNINLNKVLKEGLSPGIACQEIYVKIRNYLGNSLINKIQLPIAGHNVGFDISFLKRLYRLSGIEYSYSDIFNHRSLDTASILRFLQLTNKAPTDKCSSDVLFKFCNVEVPLKQRHTAIGDALATAKSLEYLVSTMKG